MHRDDNSTSGQFALEGKSGVGSELFQVSRKLDELFVAFRFVNLNEVLSMYRRDGSSFSVNRRTVVLRNLPISLEPPG